MPDAARSCMDKADKIPITELYLAFVHIDQTNDHIKLVVLPAHLDRVTQPLVLVLRKRHVF